MNLAFSKRLLHSDRTKFIESIKTTFQILIRNSFDAMDSTHCNVMKIWVFCFFLFKFIDTSLQARFILLKNPSLVAYDVCRRQQLWTSTLGNVFDAFAPQSEVYFLILIRTSSKRRIHDNSVALSIQGTCDILLIADKI